MKMLFNFKALDKLNESCSKKKFFLNFSSILVKNGYEIL